MKTRREQLNDVAHKLAAASGWTVDEAFDFSANDHPRGKSFWTTVLVVFEGITGDRPDLDEDLDALEEVPVAKPMGEMVTQEIWLNTEKLTKFTAIVQAAVDAGEKLKAEDAEFDDEASRDFGGNQDDAFAAGKREGEITGRVAMAEELLALFATTTVLKLWTNGVEWVVAADNADAVKVWEEHTGSDSADYEHEWREDKRSAITVKDEDGEGSQTHSAAEWAAMNKRCLLWSTED